MREHKAIREELEELSPFLAKLKGQDEGFKVPKGYFDTLENNIFARIKAEEEVESWGSAVSDNTEIVQSNVSWLDKVKNLVLRPQIGIGIAMIVVIGFGISMLNQPTVSTVELASDEANEYFQENIEQFSQTLILETIGEDLAEADMTSSIEISEEVLDNYIQEHMIEDMDGTLLDEFL